MSVEDARRGAFALALFLAILAPLTTAAPLSDSTEIESYDEEAGCYYNFQHYGEGDRIMTNEPCLNCTCHNRMLMCYLRVCPFTKPIGQDCVVEKRGDQCCPIITCPDVPVDLVDSTTVSTVDSTEVGHHDNYGCSIDGRFYSEGAQVPSTPNKPCELCYCIRNMTACVMQECTLHVEGCTPVYQRGVCCPVRYSCDHPEEEGPLMIDDMTTTVRPTPGFILTTTLMPGYTMECTYNDEVFADGANIATDKPCEHCYCMKGDIVCAVQECGTPMENKGKNCTAHPPAEGKCCPDSYVCEGEGDSTTMHPADESATTQKQEDEKEVTKISDEHTPTTESHIDHASTDVDEDIQQTTEGHQETTRVKDQKEEHVTEQHVTTEKIPTHDGDVTTTGIDEEIVTSTDRRPEYEHTTHRDDIGEPSTHGEDIIHDHQTSPPTTEKDSQPTEKQTTANENIFTEIPSTKSPDNIPLDSVTEPAVTAEDDEHTVEPGTHKTTPIQEHPQTTLGGIKLDTERYPDQFQIGQQGEDFPGQEQIEQGEEKFPDQEQEIITTPLLGPSHKKDDQPESTSSLPSDLTKDYGSDITVSPDDIGQTQVTTKQSQEPEYSSEPIVTQKDDLEHGVETSTLGEPLYSASTVSDGLYTKFSEDDKEQEDKTHKPTIKDTIPHLLTEEPHYESSGDGIVDDNLLKELSTVRPEYSGDDSIDHSGDSDIEKETEKQPGKVTISSTTVESQTDQPIDIEDKTKFTTQPSVPSTEQSTIHGLHEVDDKSTEKDSSEEEGDETTTKYTHHGESSERPSSHEESDESAEKDSSQEESDESSETPSSHEESDESTEKHKHHGIGDEKTEKPSSEEDSDESTEKSSSQGESDETTTKHHDEVGVSTEKPSSQEESDESTTLISRDESTEKSIHHGIGDEITEKPSTQEVSTETTKKPSYEEESDVSTEKPSSHDDSTVTPSTLGESDESTEKYTHHEDESSEKSSTHGEGDVSTVTSSTRGDSDESTEKHIHPAVGDEETEKPSSEEETNATTEKSSSQGEDDQTTEKQQHHDEEELSTEKPSSQEESDESTEKQAHHGVGDEKTEKPSSQEESDEITVTPSSQGESDENIEKQHHHGEGEVTTEKSIAPGEDDETTEKYHHDEGKISTVKPISQVESDESTTPSSHEESDESTEKQSHYGVSDEKTEQPISQGESDETTKQHLEEGEVSTKKPSSHGESTKTPTTPGESDEITEKHTYHGVEDVKTDKPISEGESDESTEKPSSQGERDDTTEKPSSQEESDETTESEISTKKPSYLGDSDEGIVTHTTQGERDESTEKQTHHGVEYEKTEKPSSEGESDESTEKLSSQGESDETTKKPHHRDEGEVSTIKPISQEESDESTERPSSQGESDETTKKPYHHDEGEVSTIKPISQEESDESTEKPTHHELGDEKTETPSSEESSDGTTEKPSSQGESDGTTEQHRYHEGDESTEKSSSEGESDETTEKSSTQGESDEITEKPKHHGDDVSTEKSSSEEVIETTTHQKIEGETVKVAAVDELEKQHTTVLPITGDSSITDTTEDLSHVHDTSAPDTTESEKDIGDDKYLSTVRPDVTEDSKIVKDTTPVTEHHDHTVVDYKFDSDLGEDQKIGDEHEVTTAVYQKDDKIVDITTQKQDTDDLQNEIDDIHDTTSVVSQETTPSIPKIDLAEKPYTEVEHTQDSTTLKSVFDQGTTLENVEITTASHLRPDEEKSTHDDAQLISTTGIPHDLDTDSKTTQIPAQIATTLEPVVTDSPVTEINEEDNEIHQEIDQHPVTDYVPPRIPGEGDCLIDGSTYRNGAIIPTANKCQTSCQCVNSVLKCDQVVCSPPPSNMINCQPIYHGKDTCCPMYTCEHESVTIESDNQMSDLSTPLTEQAVEQITKSTPEKDIIDEVVATHKPVEDSFITEKEAPVDSKTEVPIVEKPIIPITYLPDCQSSDCKITKPPSSDYEPHEIPEEGHTTEAEVDEKTELNIIDSETQRPTSDEKSTEQSGDDEQTTKTHVTKVDDKLESEVTTQADIIDTTKHVKDISLPVLDIDESSSTEDSIKEVSTEHISTASEQYVDKATTESILGDEITTHIPKHTQIGEDKNETEEGTKSEEDGVQQTTEYSIVTDGGEISSESPDDSLQDKFDDNEIHSTTDDSKDKSTVHAVTKPTESSSEYDATTIQPSGSDSTVRDTVQEVTTITYKEQTTSRPVIDYTTISSDDVNKIGVSVLPTDSVEGILPKKPDTPAVSSCGHAECQVEVQFTRHPIDATTETATKKETDCGENGCDDEQQNIITDDSDKPICGPNGCDVKHPSDVIPDHEKDDKHVESTTLSLGESQPTDSPITDLPSTDFKIDCRNNICDSNKDTDSPTTKHPEVDIISQDDCGELGCEDGKKTDDHSESSIPTTLSTHGTDIELSTDEPRQPSDVTDLPDASVKPAEQPSTEIPSFDISTERVTEIDKVSEDDVTLRPVVDEKTTLKTSEESTTPAVLDMTQSTDDSVHIKETFPPHSHVTEEAPKQTTSHNILDEEHSVPTESDFTISTEESVTELLSEGTEKPSHTIPSEDQTPSSESKLTEKPEQETVPSDVTEASKDTSDVSTTHVGVIHDVTESSEEDNETDIDEKLIPTTVNIHDTKTTQEIVSTTPAIISVSDIEHSTEAQEQTTLSSQDEIIKQIPIENVESPQTTITESDLELTEATHKLKDTQETTPISVDDKYDEVSTEAEEEKATESAKDAETTTVHITSISVDDKHDQISTEAEQEKVTESGKDVEATTVHITSISVDDKYDEVSTEAEQEKVTESGKDVEATTVHITSISVDDKHDEISTEKEQEKVTESGKDVEETTVHITSISDDDKYDEVSTEAEQEKVTESGKDVEATTVHITSISIDDKYDETSTEAEQEKVTESDKDVEGTTIVDSKDIHKPTESTDEHIPQTTNIPPEHDETTVIGDDKATEPGSITKSSTETPDEQTETTRFDGKVEGSPITKIPDISTEKPYQQSTVYDEEIVPTIASIDSHDVTEHTVAGEHTTKVQGDDIDHTSETIDTVDVKKPSGIEDHTTSKSEVGDSQTHKEAEEDITHSTVSVEPHDESVTKPYGEKSSHIPESTETYLTDEPTDSPVIPTTLSTKHSEDSGESSTEGEINTTIPPHEKLGETTISDVDRKSVKPEDHIVPTTISSDSEEVTKSTEKYESDDHQITITESDLIDKSTEHSDVDTHLTTTNEAPYNVPTKQQEDDNQQITTDADQDESKKPVDHTDENVDYTTGKYVTSTVQSADHTEDISYTTIKAERDEVKKPTEKPEVDITSSEGAEQTPIDHTTEIVSHTTIIAEHDETKISTDLPVFDVTDTTVSSGHSEAQKPLDQSDEDISHTTASEESDEAKRPTEQPNISQTTISSSEEEEKRPHDHTTQDISHTTIGEDSDDVKKPTERPDDYISETTSSEDEGKTPLDHTEEDVLYTPVKDVTGEVKTPTERPDIHTTAGDDIDESEKPIDHSEKDIIHTTISGDEVTKVTEHPDVQTTIAVERDETKRPVDFTEESGVDHSTESDISTTAIEDKLDVKRPTELPDEDIVHTTISTEEKPSEENIAQTTSIIKDEDVHRPTDQSLDDISHTTVGTVGEDKKPIDETMPHTTVSAEKDETRPEGFEDHVSTTIVADEEQTVKTPVVSDQEIDKEILHHTEKPGTTLIPESHEKEPQTDKPSEDEDLETPSVSDKFDQQTPDKYPDSASSHPEHEIPETTPTSEESTTDKPSQTIQTSTITVHDYITSKIPFTEATTETPFIDQHPISPSKYPDTGVEPDLGQEISSIPNPDEDEDHQEPQPSFPGYGSPGADTQDYEEEDQSFGPGTCRYGGKVYVSAQQIPRDDPCDFCFCFRSDIICLQQSCPPPIQHCHEEPIQGFCCPRYECPVSMATVMNVTTTTTTTTTTLPPHFLSHAYKGQAQRRGCQIKGQVYQVGEVIKQTSGPCLHCICGRDGQMKCDPKVCTPEPMLRQMIAVAATSRRR